MAIQWDLLRPLISVPYVPTLGPNIYPEAVTAGLFAEVLLPTLSIRRAARVKVHIYSLDPRTAVTHVAKLCRRLCQEYGAAKGLIAWFLPPGSDPDSLAACTRVQLRVLPGYRGRGLGRALWRAAMRWGQEREAAYQNLQTEVGGASDRLCRSEGLTDLGLVCTLTL